MSEIFTQYPHLTPRSNCAYNTFTPTDMLRAIDACNAHLDSYITSIERRLSGLSSRDLHDMPFPSPSWPLEEWQTRGLTVLHARLTMKDLPKVRELLGILQQMRGANNVARFKVESNTLQYGDQMFHCSVETFLMHTVIDGVYCGKCNALIPRDMELKHQATWNCEINYRTKLANDAEYVRVSDAGEANAIRMTLSVPSMMVPRMFDTYAPKWVVDAVESFKSSNGYADLSLEEFLSRLSKDESGCSQ